MCTQQWHEQHFAFAGTAPLDNGDDELATEVEQLVEDDQEENPEATTDP